MPTHARRTTQLKGRARMNSVVLAQVFLDRGTPSNIAADLNALLSKTFDLQDQTKSLADSLAPYKNVDRPELISKSRRFARFALPRRYSTQRRKLSGAPSHQKMVPSPFKHLIALFHPRSTTSTQAIDAAPPSLSTHIPDSALLQDLTDALSSLSVSEASASSQLPTRPLTEDATVNPTGNAPVARRRKRYSRAHKRSHTPTYACPDPFPMVSANTASGPNSRRSSWVSINSSSASGSSYAVPATPVTSSYIPSAEILPSEEHLYQSGRNSVSLCVLTDTEDDPDPFAKATVQVVHSQPPSPSRSTTPRSRRQTSSMSSFAAAGPFLLPPASPASSARRRSAVAGRHARKRSIQGGSYSLPSSPSRRPRSTRTDPLCRVSRADLPFPPSSLAHSL